MLLIILTSIIRIAFTKSYLDVNILLTLTCFVHSC